MDKSTSELQPAWANGALVLVDPRDAEEARAFCATGIPTDSEVAQPHVHVLLLLSMLLELLIFKMKSVGFGKTIRSTRRCADLLAREVRKALREVVLSALHVVVESEYLQDLTSKQFSSTRDGTSVGS